MTAKIGINIIAAMTQATRDKTPIRLGRTRLALYADVATIELRIKQSYFTVQNRVALSVIQSGQN